MFLEYEVHLQNGVYSSIYRYNVVSGNVYALSGRHYGPHSSSIK